MALASPLSAAQRTPGAAPALKVLVVDPNATNRVRLKDTLRGLEIVESVSEISRVPSVVEFLKDNRVNVILIDQEATERDIFEVIKQIQQQPAAAKTEFVLVGEEVTDEIKSRGQEVGVRGYLSRPYDMRRLETAIMDAVRPTGPPPGAPKADHRKEFLDKLRLLTLFQRFSNDELVRLMKICKAYRIAAGTHVFQEGEEGRSLFVLVSGQVDIVKDSNGQQQVLVSMHPGDVFGEMAIVDAEPRFAAAQAATDCTVIEVNASLVNNNDDVISLKLVRSIAILLVKKLRALSK
jgi:CheY-like chemotaxis protein